MIGIVKEVKEYTLFYSLVFWGCVLSWLLLSDRFRGTIFDTSNNRTKFEGLYDRVMNVSTNTITNENKMKILELKMNSFNPKPSYFYLDSGIVELMYSIKEFSEYSKSIFGNIIRLLDKFLKLTLHSDQAYIYENLKDVKKEILNNMHFLILNIPKNIELEDKLDKAINSMHYILNYHLEKIRLNYNALYKHMGPNIHNKMIANDKVEAFNYKTVDHEIYKHMH